MYNIISLLLENANTWEVQLWKEFQYHKETKVVAPKLTQIKNRLLLIPVCVLYLLSGESLVYNMKCVFGYDYYLSTPIKACSLLKGYKKQAHFHSSKILPI